MGFFDKIFGRGRIAEADPKRDGGGVETGGKNVLPETEQEPRTKAFDLKDFDRSILEKYHTLLMVGENEAVNGQDVLRFEQAARALAQLKEEVETDLIMLRGRTKEKAESRGKGSEMEEDIKRKKIYQELLARILVKLDQVLEEYNRAVGFRQEEIRQANAIKEFSGVTPEDAKLAEEKKKIPGLIAQAQRDFGEVKTEFTTYDLVEVPTSDLKKVKRMYEYKKGEAKRTHSMEVISAKQGERMRFNTGGGEHSSGLKISGVRHTLCDETGEAGYLLKMSNDEGEQKSEYFLVASVN